MLAEPGRSNPAALALWGGMECSVVRLGEARRDQVRETGYHDNVEAGIALAAGLGIRTLRVPLLWERGADTVWQERQQAALRRHGIRAAAGLLHHGAGLGAGGLLDPELGAGLARHAGEQARRFPDIAVWVPVNEPLTTARFACLYGHWHPHHTDEASFLRALANQAWAVLLAMRAIRAVVPGATFMQTEDLGRVFSTPELRGQAAYENQRRWLSLDLVFGRVDAGHPWRSVLERAGVERFVLDALAEGEAAPDLIGINHYATSDRFLDHRVGLYPARLHGSNGRQAYADTEAVRAMDAPDQLGWLPRLREVWVRYGRPIVLSEVHLGCDDPAEQLRWLMQAWSAARTLRTEGCDIEAVTAWALFGLVDWDSLLRVRAQHVERGVFDLLGNAPPCGLLSGALASLAVTGDFAHPALNTPGWWERVEESEQKRRVG